MKTLRRYTRRPRWRHLLTFDILEDRFVPSASWHAAMLHDPSSHADSPPPAQSPPMNNHGMGPQVREWTHEGIHGQQLATMIHEAQAERRGDSGSDGANGPGTPPGNPSGSGATGHDGSTDQGPGARPVDSSSDDQGGEKDPPLGAHGSDPGAGPGRSRGDNVVPKSSNGAPTLAAAKATIASTAASIAAPIAAPTGPPTVTPSLARYDASGIGAIDPAEAAAVAPAVTLSIGAEDAGAEAPPAYRHTEVSAVESDAEERMAAVSAGNLLDAGVAVDLSAAPAADAIVAFYRWLAAQPLSAWAPWVAAVALASMATELARRQLRRRKTAEIPVLPEDVAGWVPETP